MNVLFRRSASIAPPASRRTLAALLRLIPVESFTSSSITPAAPPAKVPAFEVRKREFHVGSRSLEFRASDVARAGLAMEENFFDYDEKPAASSSNSAAKKGGDDEGLEIAKLGIAQEIVSSLEKRGITNLFPIQRAVLEPAMQGRDMIGRARTGTGKTLAFGIPVMDKIIKYNQKHGRGKNPLALMLAPTRELARQVEKEIRESSNLATICVYGGVNIHEQMKTLYYGVDVVVGTPGRIIDLIKRGALDLKEVQFVVLDEADQMLAVGFEEAVETILENLPKNRQSMMFSATMPTWIRKLTQKYLKDPVTVDLVGDSDKKLAEGITLYSIATDSNGKPYILGPLIKEHAKGGKCIIFTQTKRDADRLAYGMSRSFGCEALHGDISQAQRERTLAGFRDGRFNILVATDVAARGLDVPNVDLVIHYELPNSSEIFVHRSGRTGRAGKTGTSILVHTSEQSRAVRGIESDVGCKFTELPRITVESGGEDMFAGMSGGQYNSFGGGRMGGGRMGGGSGYNRGVGGSYGSGSGSFNRFGGGGYGSGSGSFSRGGGGGYGSGAGFGMPHGGQSGRAGGYGESGSDRFGSFGGSGSSSSAGSGFGRSSAGSGSLGNSGFGRSSSSGGSDSNRYGDFGFGSTSGDSSWNKF